MPRALPALLESAMDSGVFKAYLAIGKRTYTGAPPTSLSGHTTLITNILYCKYDGQELTIKWASSNLPEDDGLTLGSKYYIERGVTIAGVNYTIKSASLRFDDYTYKKQIVTAQFSLFSANEKPDTIAGHDTYTNILTALNPNDYYLGTVDFKTTPENAAHWGYNFYPSGKQVVLKSYQSLLSILQQKYLIQAVDNSDDSNEDEIQYFHLSSPHGATFWTSRDTTADQHLCVCWAPQLPLFAAGGVGCVFTSPDGATWQRRSIGLTVVSIAWSPTLNLFVGYGFDGAGKYATTSPDGITWTDRAALTCGTNPAICWSPEKAIFVAVGGGNVVTSPDGITWTSRTPAEVNAWQGVCWSAELSLFVAVAGGGTNRVMTSPDGITWTAHLAAEANDWLSVCWSAELSLFVAVADSGTNRVMTSPDGITWTARAAAAANQWRSVCYAPSLSIFLAVAATGSGNRLMKSTDGSNWISDTTGEDDVWYGAVWSEELGIHVVVAQSGITRIASSLTSMTPDHTITQGDITLKPDNLLRKFTWRDEAQTIHTNGGDNDIIHNLGYLESTDAPPYSLENAGRASVTVGIHLKYKTGDIFKLQTNTTQYKLYYAKVTEILDPGAEIGWRCEIELIERFGNTDGGPLPSTIERVSAYTPLVTTNFDGNLDSTVNNLQAFADKVDDLTITNPPATTAANDFQVGDGSGSWVKKTLAQTITILRTSLDSIFSQLGHTHTHASTTGQGTDDHHAKSHAHTGDGSGTVAHSSLTGATSSPHVTNGDSHDHSGGDGAQVDHGGLAGLSDNDHSQYLLKTGGVMTGAIDLDEHSLQAKYYALNDDTATSFTPDSAVGWILFNGGSGGSAQWYAIALYRVGSSPYLTLILNHANVLSSTATLTGTTGTDGKFTISANADGKIYLENRTGSQAFPGVQLILGN